MTPTTAPPERSGAGSAPTSRGEGLEPLPRPAVLPPRRRGPNVFLVAMVAVLVAGAVFVVVRMLFAADSNDLGGYLRQQVVPLVDRSNALGEQLRGFLVKPPADRSQVKSQLEQWALQSQAIVDDAALLRPPARLEAAVAYLSTTFKGRAVAMAGYRDAILSALDSTKTAGLVDRILETDRDLLAADRTYVLFATEADEAISQAGEAAVPLPPSAWFPDASQATLPAVKPFVERIVGAPQVGSGRNVSVNDIAVRPEPSRDDNGTTVVVGGPFEVAAKVQNLGERTETKLAVKIELRDATRSQLHSTTREVSLAPGEAQEVVVGDVEPFPDQENGLIVTVGPLPGETADADNARSMEFDWKRS